MIRKLIKDQWAKLLIKKISHHDVFDLLEFDDDLAVAMQNNKFDDVINFMMSRTSSIHKKKSLVQDLVWDDFLEFLRRHFRGDAALVQQIKSSESRVELSDNLASLKNHLFQKWRKLSLDSVWNGLQFGNVYTIFSNGKLEMFYEYTLSFSPHAAIKKAIQTYEENGVTLAQQAASVTPSTKNFASKMYHERLEFWKAEGYSVTKVFDELELRNEDRKFLVIYKLKTLSDYIWSSSNKAKVVTDEIKDLARLTSIALTENLKIKPRLSATYVRDKLIEAWTHDPISPEDLFSKLTSEKAIAGKDHESKLDEANTKFDREYHITFSNPRRS
ncbi:hypothetical protein Plhal703r1_c13g0067141 [Plasmopara halstedii]